MRIKKLQRTVSYEQGNLNVKRNVGLVLIVGWHEHGWLQGMLIWCVTPCTKFLHLMNSTDWSDCRDLLFITITSTDCNWSFKLEWRIRDSVQVFQGFAWHFTLEFYTHWCHGGQCQNVFGSKFLLHFWWKMQSMFWLWLTKSSAWYFCLVDCDQLFLETFRVAPFAVSVDR